MRIRSIMAGVSRAGLLRGFANEIHRINPAAVMQHLEMQIRASSAPGFAHQSNNLTFLDLISDGNKVF